MAFKHAIFDDRSLLYVLHPDEPPSDADWALYLDTAEEAIAAQRGIYERIVGITVTDGGAPNAAQRKMLVHRVRREGQKPRAVVITESLLVRGVVTALSWFNAEVRVFKPSDLREAIRHSQLPPDSVHRILSDFREMQRDIAPVHTLHAMEREMVSSSA